METNLIAHLQLDFAMDVFGWIAFKCRVTLRSNPTYAINTQ
jgi:hypothetical protein